MSLNGGSNGRDQIRDWVRMSRSRRRSSRTLSASSFSFSGELSSTSNRNGESSSSSFRRNSKEGFHRLTNLQQVMIEGMTRDWIGFTILTKIEIGAVRVGALESSSSNRRGLTAVASNVVVYWSRVDSRVPFQVARVVDRNEIVSGMDFGSCRRGGIASFAAIPVGTVGALHASSGDRLLTDVARSVVNEGSGDRSGRRRTSGNNGRSGGDDARSRLTFDFDSTSKRRKSGRSRSNDLGEGVSTGMELSAEIDARSA